MATDKDNAREEFAEEDITVLESGRVRFEMYRYNDEYFPIRLAMRPFIADPRSNFPAIKNMKVRSDDIFVCAYFKAGTHWVWEVTSMLLKGKAEYNTIPKEMYMLDFKPVESFETLPSPRLMNTHLPLDVLPRDMVRQKPRILFVYRNPKDVVVSAYHHLRGLHHITSEENCFEDLVDLFMTDAFIHNAWSKYMPAWEKAMGDNSGLSILPVCYEEMKMEPKTNVIRIAEFLQVPYSESLIDDIVNLTSFETMKQAKKMEEGLDGTPGHHGKVMYRKGEVGDWKNWFTVAKNEQFDAFLADKMKNSKLKYIYELPS